MDLGRPKQMHSLEMPNPSTPALEGVVRSHSAQLTKLNSEISSAFSQVTLPILREGGTPHQYLSHAAKRPGSLAGGVLVSRTYTRSPSSVVNQLFPASLAWGLESLTVGALLDSGADECLIDIALARQARIHLEPLDTTLLFLPTLKYVVRTWNKCELTKNNNVFIHATFYMQIVYVCSYIGTGFLDIEK